MIVMALNHVGGISNMVGDTLWQECECRVVPLGYHDAGCALMRVTGLCVLGCSLLSPYHKHPRCADGGGLEEGNPVVLEA